VSFLRTKLAADHLVHHGLPVMDQGGIVTTHFLRRSRLSLHQQNLLNPRIAKRQHQSRLQLP
jgi:hypothetical protein